MRWQFKVKHFCNKGGGSSLTVGACYCKKLAGTQVKTWLETTPKGEVQLDNFREEDLYSTLPAICYMSKKMREELPCGNVVFIINTGLDERISSAIKTASEHFGTRYIELSDIDKMSGHPTVKGMAQIAEQVSKYIKKNNI